MNFWEMVEWEREYKGISRKELAYKAGFAVNSIPSGIARDSVPLADVACRIAKVLGVSVEYLLSGQAATGVSSLPSAQDESVSQQLAQLKQKYLKHHTLINDLGTLPKEVQESIENMVHTIKTNFQ